MEMVITLLLAKRVVRKPVLYFYDPVSKIYNFSKWWPYFDTNAILKCATERQLKAVCVVPFHFTIIQPSSRSTPSVGGVDNASCHRSLG